MKKDEDLPINRKIPNIDLPLENDQDPLYLDAHPSKLVNIRNEGEIPLKTLQQDPDQVVYIHVKTDPSGFIDINKAMTFNDETTCFISIKGASDPNERSTILSHFARANEDTIYHEQIYHKQNNDIQGVANVADVADFANSFQTSRSEDGNQRCPSYRKRRSHMVVDNEKVLPILEVQNKRLRLHKEQLSWKVKTLKAYYLKAIETGKLVYSG
eukprot:TRINITY_DN29466_c0_g1_i1.p1 TRINITY_DN29466_c0_g1~~TRINITY_DN29466_c0_g1_i1.p1  ORF type:complete len:213 (-),score=53.26 TRINITY_DN29466_c0_g1_i1:235-873(-)